LRDDDAVIEVTYQTQIAPWWTVQPDLQVILHPGGNSLDPTLAAPRAIPDALVIGLRTSLVF
jgi:porin